MSEEAKSEEVVWTPRMVDRRQDNRRGNADLQTNGKTLNISNMRKGADRRNSLDRRENNSVTITGRAIDVEDAHL